ncbi:MAG: hypothetical protein QY320_10810 [Gammaproteobacteria bacterium]|nr:MAG: hypothetical protein QY320_10810 [Gammaproteobacteria bacterium]
MQRSSWYVGAAVLVLSGCAQFTTNRTERAALEAAASEAGDAYVDCIVEAAQRYHQSGEAASVIADVARDACTAARSAFEQADTTYVKSKYMRTVPVVTQDLAALEARARTLVEKQVLERKAGAPAASVAIPAAAPLAPAATVARPAAAPLAPDGQEYLDCMRAQGERYAAVDEPAEVVAEVAHSRCATALADPASAVALERQGRALVMGMVLDRKRGP